MNKKNYIHRPTVKEIVMTRVRCYLLRILNTAAPQLATCRAKFRHNLSAPHLFCIEILKISILIFIEMNYSKHNQHIIDYVYVEHTFLP